MNQQEKEKLIEQWLEGRASDEELLAAISAEELNQYKAILQTVDNWEPLGSQDQVDRLNEILSTPKEARVVSMNRTPWIVGIAASIALLATLTVLFFGSQDTVYYAENEVLEILLPDGTTTAMLSPGARLSFDDFDESNRAVEIEGRVYFDVTEKGAFNVTYDNGSIAVLGTQFEIVQFEDFFEASCFEGKVRVQYEGVSAEMVEGERVNYQGDQLPKIQINQRKPGWTLGEERFENDELVKVIKILEEWYKVDINAEKISLDRRFTGSIPTDDLDAACKRLFSALGINYQIQNKTIILSE